MPKRTTPAALVSSPATAQDQRPLGIAGSSITGTVPVGSGGTGTSTPQPTNRIIVAGPAGVFTSDAGLVFDLTNKRLGVGTSAPVTDTEISKAGIGATPIVVATSTPMPGLRLVNPTAATVGSQVQSPPGIEFVGSAWDIDHAVARPQRYGLYCVENPANVPHMYLALRYDEGAGAGWTAGGDDMRFGRVLAGDVPSLRFADGNLVFRNANRGIVFTAAPLTDSTSAPVNVLSGDVLSSTYNRLKATVIAGYVFIEGNNSGFSAGSTPSMDFRNFDQSVTSPIMGIRHRATPFGTAGANFGVRQQYQANSTTTADQDQGAFDIVWTDATHASRSAAFRVLLVNAAAAQAVKFQVQPTGLLVLGAPGIGVPALKPVGADLEARLGDDSAYAQFRALRLLVSAGERLDFDTRSRITSPADGQLLVTNAAATDFTRLMLGGTSASFPALKRSSAVLEVKLADDSAYGDLRAFALRITDGTFLIRSGATLNNGAGAGAGTLTNAPAAGDPTKWIPVDDNGVTRHVPSW